MASIGISQADITPPVGIPLAGFADRDTCTAVHDPLCATALVARDQHHLFALVDCDLLYVDNRFLSKVRAEVQNKSGIPAGNLMISCTHTHYGPNVCGGYEVDHACQVEPQAARILVETCVTLLHDVV